jgi:hypothetical protein
VRVESVHRHTDTDPDALPGPVGIVSLGDLAETHEPSSTPAKISSTPADR